jgi:hypothetical protein
VPVSTHSDINAQVAGIRVSWVDGGVAVASAVERGP